MDNQKVQDFLTLYNYDSESNSDILDLLFTKAVDTFLTGDINDLFTLSEIAKELEANPAIHNSQNSKYIYSAIDLDYNIQNEQPELYSNFETLFIFKLNNIQDKSESVAELLNYKAEGFLFHGSSNSQIQILEPRLAIDSDSTNNFNNDTAVFATNNIATAVIFSLVDRNNFPIEVRNFDWQISWNEFGIPTAEIPSIWQNSLEMINGYVYILSRDTFLDRRGAQFKSKVSVIPIKKIFVTIQDYENLGGKINWIK